MRVLWLATCESFYDYVVSNSNFSTDSEGGWYTGLHQAIQLYDTEHTIELGIAFTCNKIYQIKQLSIIVHIIH